SLLINSGLQAGASWYQKTAGAGLQTRVPMSKQHKPIKNQSPKTSQQLNLKVRQQIQSGRDLLGVARLAAA
ncbi:MAG: hypothetical protein K8F24_08600, partial [Bacteroidales bacterium]|nr:hypothetical protein [Bacteroidales bacterium]